MHIITPMRSIAGGELIHKDDSNNEELKKGNLNMNIAPKVFVSHASDDKERFVLEFAKKLYAVGIEAWVDKWEMLPGDSLVHKIFEEGIKNAEAFIIVISKYSIIKPWIKEELNTAIVKRISDNTKIIPIVLDGVKVPECLKSTVYEEINNPLCYEDSFERIRNSVFDIYDKPSLGKIPKYVNSIFDSYGGLSKVDSIILHHMCEMAIEAKSTYRLISDDLFERVTAWEISQMEFKTSLDILNRKHYIKGTRVLSGDIPIFELTFSSLGIYIRQHYSNFDQIERRVCAAILNSEGDNIEIADNISIPLVIVNYIYDKLKSRGLINYRATLSGGYIIYDISPELFRIMQTQ